MSQLRPSRERAKHSRCRPGLAASQLANLEDLDKELCRQLPRIVSCLRWVRPAHVLLRNRH